jgi:hypothetical protein
VSQGVEAIGLSIFSASSHSMTTPNLNGTSDIPAVTVYLGDQQLGWAARPQMKFVSSERNSPKQGRQIRCSKLPHSTVMHLSVTRIFQKVGTSCKHLISVVTKKVTSLRGHRVICAKFHYTRDHPLHYTYDCSKILHQAEDIRVLFSQSSPTQTYD